MTFDFMLPYSEDSVAWLTVNREESELNKERLTFFGHGVNKNGILAKPQKTSAILEM